MAVVSILKWFPPLSSKLIFSEIRNLRQDLDNLRRDHSDDEKRQLLSELGKLRREQEELKQVKTLLE
ncbi:MAG: hypothetical protein HC773_15985, partial [Scytonema sp. CRU_2_7]|nr:hypothetical protein [Scytonema sp. CRU_2_7]